VIVDWEAPNDNGTPITGYRILFRKSDDTYSTLLSHCDGSDVTIKQTTECTVPLSVLYAEPFNLNVLGSSINVKVVAVNAYGESDESEIGGGAVI